MDVQKGSLIANGVGFYKNVIDYRIGSNPSDHVFLEANYSEASRQFVVETTSHNLPMTIRGNLWAGDPVTPYKVVDTATGGGMLTIEDNYLLTSAATYDANFKIILGHENVRVAGNIVPNANVFDLSVTQQASFRANRYYSIGGSLRTLPDGDYTPLIAGGGGYNPHARGPTGASQLSNLTAVGGLNTTALVTPSTPTVTPQGTTGATTYGYKIVWRTKSGGNTAASAEGTTATGNATLNGTNFNRIFADNVTGGAVFDVYRTTGGATQGLIGTRRMVRDGLTDPDPQGNVFDDTGLVGDSASAPSTNTTGGLVVTGGTAIYGLRWNATASVADGGTIAHGMGAAPTACLLTIGTAGEMATGTWDGTNITVGLKKHDGTAGTTQTVSWLCLR